MNHVIHYFRELKHGIASGWDRFWFTPSDPATLCVIRILAGSMLFYTHLVWSVDLAGFFGRDGKLSPEFCRAFMGNSPAGWSHLLAVESNGALWASHIACLAILACFTVGLWTRVTGILSCLITISYAHRGSGALFGLDQINALLVIYLMLGPSGAMYSIDAWIGGKRDSHPIVGATIAIRLIQLHMCIIYLFAGAGKLLGASWWDGTALWGAFANYEYQTWDMTWLAQHEQIVNFLTHLTIAWEISYVAVVWNRLARPIVILLAIPLHLGIGLCMGMMTFGLVMIYGNLAFASPRLVRAAVGWLAVGARNQRL